MRKRRIIGMIAGGVGLSLFLYAALFYVDRRNVGGPDAGSAATRTPVAASLAPVRIDTVVQGEGADGASLRVEGRAQPDSAVVLTDRGERIRQVRTDDTGVWVATLPVSDAPMAVEAELFTGEDGAQQVSLRGVETLFRIHRASDRSAGSPPLVMVSAPAAPSRIVSSPFGALPSEGPLVLGAIDYDDAGGVIFSGLSEVPGRVRLYAADSAIGDTRVGADGRWAYIAASVMPLGRYEVRAELQPEAGGPRVSITVPFERLPPVADAGDGSDGALTVNFQPTSWQIRRTLVGGGVQTTAIFAPGAR